MSSSRAQAAIPTSGLELRSTVTPEGKLELSLVDVPVPSPKSDEILLRVEAAPLNPSDLALLFGSADMTTAHSSGSPELPRISADIPPETMRAMAGRVGKSMPVGNEGAGVVVAAGESSEAQALLGRTVAVVGGGMYTQFRCVKAITALPLPEGTTPAEGASCFVNPLTSLAMTECMKLEGHSALVHTAAASNLGQMLVRICKADGIPLVNIVRKQQQVDLLEGQGAEFVVNSSVADFMPKLVEALAATRATLAFDAIGGGDLANQILTAMEAAALREAKEYSRYGSNVHKQVYIYGALDRTPTVLTRSYGLQWGVAGWLLTPFLQRVGPEIASRMRMRVASELKTTFASHYARQVSLSQALSLDALAEYGRQTTGLKYLIRPNASD